MGWCNPLQSWKWSCLQGFYDSPCLGKPSMGAANIFFREFAGSSGSDHGVPNPLNKSPCIFGETHKFETHKFGSCRNNIDEMQWEKYRKIGSWAEWPWTRFICFITTPSVWWEVTWLEHIVIPSLCLYLTIVKLFFGTVLWLPHISLTRTCAIFKANLSYWFFYLFQCPAFQEKHFPSCVLLA